MNVIVNLDGGILSSGFSSVESAERFASAAIGSGRFVSAIIHVDPGCPVAALTDVLRMLEPEIPGFIEQDGPTVPLRSRYLEQARTHIRYAIEVLDPVPRSTDPDPDPDPDPDNPPLEVRRPDLAIRVRNARTLADAREIVTEFIMTYPGKTGTDKEQTDES